MVWSYTGNFGDNAGGNLWHKTDFDSWSGSNALGWFNKNTQHYENDVYVNYVKGPTVNMEDAEEMYMDFYVKWNLDIYIDIGAIGHTLRGGTYARQSTLNKYPSRLEMTLNINRLISFSKYNNI